MDFFTLELINALSILKFHSSQGEKANIDAILKKTQISLPHSQLNLDLTNIKDSIETIKIKLEKGQPDLSESEIKFSFECRYLDMRSFMDEMSQLSYENVSDYFINFLVFSQKTNVQNIFFLLWIIKLISPPKMCLYLTVH